MILEAARRRFLGNPIIGRQISTTMTGGRLGSAALLVNGTLLITLIALFAFFADGQVRSSEMVPAGSLIYFFQNLILYFLLCLLLPIKISGHIEGARLGKAFDQVVVTGCSPFRNHIGSWGIGIVYAAIILFFSLPYAGAAYLFGGVSLAQIASAYLILFFYSNVILLVTIAMSCFEREWVTAVAAICLFGGFGLSGAIMEREFIEVFRTQISDLTPTRLFWREVQPYDLSYYAPARFGEALFADPYLFGFRIPISVYPYVLWSLICVAATLLMAIGPSHRFLPGLNNFGSVVLAGDRKKRLFRRLRGALSRKVEVAFYYENRAPWCDRWDFPIKILISALGLVFFWAILQGAIYGGSYRLQNNFFNDDAFIATVILSLLALLAWGGFWADPKHRVYWIERIGPFRVPREIAIAVVFLVLLFSYSFAVNTIIGNARADYTNNIDATATGSLDPSVLDGFNQASQFVYGLCLFAFTLFLVSRCCSRLTQSLIFTRLSTVIMGGFLVLGPLFIFLLSSEVDQFPASFDLAGSLSPLFLVDEMFDRWPEWTNAKRMRYYFAAQSALVVMLLSLLFLLHLLNARKQRSLQSPTKTPLVAAALLLTILPMSTASAQQEEEGDATAEATRASPLEIVSVERGFGGTVYSESVDFMSVIVRNPTSEPIQGEYYASEPYDFGWRSEAAPFEIGANTTKVVHWRRSAMERSGMRHQVRLVFEHDGRRRETVERQLQVNQVLRSRSNGKTTNRTYAFVNLGEFKSSGWEHHLKNGSSAGPIKNCKITSIPESESAYLGVTAVLVPSQDLTRWTGPQRQALYNYLRQGGSVVFYGSLKTSESEGTNDIWESLLESSGLTIEEERAQFVVESLEESRTVLTIPGKSGDIPILQTRAIGPGRLSHTSINLAKPVLPTDIDLAKFWRRFGNALPRSMYPIISHAGNRSDAHLRDASSLFIILAYYLAYTLVTGVGLLLFFRSRKRRKAVWVMIPVCVATFLLGLPMLDALIHSRPSYSELREITWYTAGSTLGTVHSNLHTRSSGRQNHDVKIDTEDPIAFDIPQRYSWEWRNMSARGLPVDISHEIQPREPSGQELALLVQPWAERSVTFVGTKRLQKPISGQAKLIKRGGARISLKVDLPPEANLQELYLISMGLDQTASRSQSRKSVKLTRIQGFEVKNGLYETNISLNSDFERLLGQNNSLQEFTFQTRAGDHHWRVTATGLPRVLIAWAPTDTSPAIGLSSDDLALEQSFPLEERRRLLSYGDSVQLHEREGRLIRDLHSRLVVVDIPIDLE